MRPASAQHNLLVPVLASGVAIIALLWFAAIGPKRSDRAHSGDVVSTQQQRLDRARKQITAYTASRERFDGMLVELRQLDIAVPARGDISGLLREVQRRARLRNSDLRLATLKTSAGVAGSAKPATPGAAPGPGGLSALPFTFSYTGRYFDLLKLMRTVREAVTVRSGNLSIDGRLLTIDGVSFRRPNPASKLTKVVLNATAYIAADTTKAPAAAEPSAAAAKAKAGS
ncbi:MAG: hypothetical protein M3401_03595 [Actinomycetota bacterium]|nr:hypothetical protein [Actinomycetota bacterium]